MKVNEILNSNLSLDGKEVLLKSNFIMKRGVAFFSDEFADAANMENSIFINFKNLENILLSSVPAYAGSAYSYCDKAEIRGILDFSTDSGFRAEISSISEFTIFKHDFPFSVDLGVD